eukprot:GHVU01087854.1.p1 GENE.GHVU01087854.1~~GHVU01087854.1.p1  ORF type:complete len:264 (-),score=22.84 GHVU01087854.1:1524-2315(-)
MAMLWGEDSVSRNRKPPPPLNNIQISLVSGVRELFLKSTDRERDIWSDGLYHFIEMVRNVFGKTMTKLIHGWIMRVSAEFVFMISGRMICCPEPHVDVSRLPPRMLQLRSYLEKIPSRRKSKSGAHRLKKNWSLKENEGYDEDIKKDESTAEGGTDGNNDQEGYHSKAQPDAGLQEETEGGNTARVAAAEGRNGGDKSGTETCLDQKDEGFGRTGSLDDCSDIVMESSRSATEAHDSIPRLPLAIAGAMGDTSISARGEDVRQ